MLTRQDTIRWDAGLEQQSALTRVAQKFASGIVFKILHVPCAKYTLIKQHADDCWHMRACTAGEETSDIPHSTGVAVHLQWDITAACTESMCI